MNVTYRDTNYYLVSDGEQQYAAAKVPGGWMIVDQLGDDISPSGVLGSRVVAAIAVAQCPAGNPRHYA